MFRRVWFAAAGALLLVAGVLRADTVVLRDGRVITGHVIEQGDKIYIEVRDPAGTTVLGGLAVARTEVVRIETAAGGAREAVTFDTVVLTDGRIVRGDARVSPDAAEVIVALGDRGEVRHPRNFVAVIKWRDGRAEGGVATAEDPHAKRLNETIDRRVRELMHGTDVEKLEARRELLALGTFSRAYVNALAEKHRPRLDDILADLDRLEALRKVLPARAEEAIPRIGERLVSHDAGERESALRSVVMEAPDAVGPLLLHVIRTDSVGRMRAYCVSQLAALRRFEELAEVLKLGDGQLRLAAAFALGDAGILAGVPILIEALRLSDVEIRTVAIQKLTEYTGQHFGYRAQGSAEDRERSVAKWNQWWNEYGADLVRQSITTSAPGTVGAVITADEKLRAQELWGEANRLIGTALQLRPPPRDGRPVAVPGDPKQAQQRAQSLERAQDLLRQALDIDPTLSSARMTRAVLLYEELDRPRDAERQLNWIIERAEFDSAQSPDAAKKFATYHLGLIALRQGMWERATVKLTQALQYDAGFQDALIALGDTHFALATAPTDAGGPEKIEARRQALVAARKTFFEALKAIEREEADLRGVTRDLVADAPDSIAEGQVLQAVRKSLGDLQRRRASVHFRVGRACAALQDDKAALEAYRTAYTLDPRNKGYEEALRAWGDNPAPAVTDPPADRPRTDAPSPGPGRAGGRERAQR